MKIFVPGDSAAQSVGADLVAVAIAATQSNVTSTQIENEIFVPDSDPTAVTMD